MKLSKSIAIASMIALAVAPLAACGSQSSGKTTVEVTGIGQTTPQYKVLEKQARAFEQANKDITIKLVPSSSSYEADLKVRLAGNNAPDIYNTHGWSRDRYGKFLVDLSKRSWAKNVNPILKDALKDANGSFYALPMDASVTGLLYNETVLKEAGIDPSTLTNWNAFTQACATLKAKDITCISIAGKDNWTTGTLIDYMLGGYYTKSQLNELKKGTFSNDIYTKAAEQVAQWAKAGYFPVDYSSTSNDDQIKLFAQNKVAFAAQGGGFVVQAAQINPDLKAGMLPMPSSVGDPYVLVGEDVAFGVSKTSKVKDAALKFIDWLAKDQAGTDFAKASGNPVGLSTAKSDLGLLQETYDTYVTSGKAAIAPVFDRIYLPNGIWNSMVTTTDGLVNQQLTPAQAAEQMHSQFESLYGQNK